MTKIFGIVPVKNEQSRYLDSMLSWLSFCVDDIFVFDDQSTDLSRKIASRHTDHVVVRDSSAYSFLEHEGRYRQACWNEFEKEMNPTEDDWILAIDSDEFLVSVNPDIDPGTMLRRTINKAQDNFSAISVKIPELWELQPPQIRVDGFWNKNSLVRLFRYQKDATFKNAKMACGSCPTYVGSNLLTKDIEILHVGYAASIDRLSKYKRYSEIQDGHSSSHIESIVTPPTLQGYRGQMPIILRGWTVD